MTVISLETRPANPDEIEDIVRRWNNKESMAAIQRAYGRSNGFVRTALIRGGVSFPKSDGRGRVLKSNDRRRNGKDGFRDNHGYIRVKVTPNDPLFPMAERDGYVLEHRLVMGREFGRLLRTDEHVHHLNGKRDDNRLENLQIRHGQHGPGIVLCCSQCGSTDLKPMPLNDHESRE